MEIPSLKQMLSAGVHFGHQTLRWNPKMSQYILTERNGIHIIDLDKTRECMEQLLEGIKKVIHAGEKILFVGTKKSIKHCVEENAKECNMFYVTNRWLGGMLTNFATVKNSINTIVEIEQMEAKGITKGLKKKEIGALNKKHNKLNAVLGGIREMKKQPGLIFVVDTKSEHIAVKEARRLNIPLAAIVDTNSNPEEITYPIPGNDDAIKSVSLIVKFLTDAILEFSQNVPELSKESSEPAEAAPEKETAENKAPAEKAVPAAAAEPVAEPVAAEKVESMDANTAKEAE